MPDFNPNLYNEKYRIPTNRLSGNFYDVGWYLVTITTKERVRYLGEIDKEGMHFSDIGNACLDIINTFELRCADCEIQCFTIMPDHLHLLIRILPSHETDDNVSLDGLRDISPNVSTSGKGLPSFGHQGRLSVIIRTFKGAVTTWAKQHERDFAWQSKFYDGVITNSGQWREARLYIENNVHRWQLKYGLISD